MNEREDRQIRAGAPGCHGHHFDRLNAGLDCVLKTYPCAMGTKKIHIL
jgi:hypothetical protein